MVGLHSIGERCPGLPGIGNNDLGRSEAVSNDLVCHPAVIRTVLPSGSSTMHM